MKNLKIPGIKLDNITSENTRLRLNGYGMVYLESEISAQVSCSVHLNFPDAKVKELQKMGMFTFFISGLQHQNRIFFI